MAYQRPQVTVEQNLTIAPITVERDMTAFVFGPNYELHRYSDADEKAGTAVGQYEGSEMEFAYPGVVDDEKVDAGFTKLTGDNAVVKLVELGDAALPEAGTSAVSIIDNGGYTKLLFAGKAFVDVDVNGNEVTRWDSLPKNLAVGDVLRISYTDAGVSESVNVHVKEVAYSDTPWTNIDSDSSAEGEAGTLVTIDDAIPEGTVLSSVTADLVAVFQGVEFTSKNLSVGAGYQWQQVKVTASDGSRVNGVKVTALNAWVQDYFELPKYCPVVEADLFLTYRELITPYSDTLHSVAGASNVANMLGKVDPDNPLAMGVYMACLNAQTDDGLEAPAVYFMSIPSDDKDGYDVVLNRASLTDRVYVFAPTTRNEAVLEAVRAHVVAMSTKEVKQWRIAAACSEVKAEVARLSSADNVQGRNYYAIPVSPDGTQPGLTNYNKIRVVRAKDDIRGNTDVQFRSTIVVGDRIRFNYHTDAWSEIKYNEYLVKRVVNNYTLEVEGVVDSAWLDPAEGGQSYIPELVEVYHTYTSLEEAEQVALTSKAMASRRMLNIFPTYFNNDGVKMGGEFAACAVAGLVSATLPQQPITNMTVRGIDDIPMVYQTYSKAELDLIAAGGTFIIAQDLPGDRVYIRHQITTAYPDGNLNTAELSVTKNVDSISYAFAEAFRPYYGRYNITPKLIATLRSRATALLTHLSSGIGTYGPQVIADQTEILYVRQNEAFKDHVDVAIRLGVPYPCNVIDIVLTV